MKTTKFLIPMVATALWSCSQPVSFAPMDVTKQGILSNPSSPNGDVKPDKPPVVCQPGQVKVTRPTRVLFVVDQSGSNINGPYEEPLAATDPDKSFRMGVMNDFVRTNTDKVHVTWGLSTFNDASATNLVTDLSGSSVPFSSVLNFKVALGKFAARTDVGQTPYKAALSLAHSFIKNDIVTAPKETAYMIAFITDGYPTDYCSGGPSEVLCPGRILENEIDTDVRKIVSLNPRNVKFSTVYYGKPNGDSTARLRRMADAGLGEFVDANQSSKIDLNDIMEIQQEICVNNK